MLKTQTHTYADYTFLGTTQSLCPQCLKVVPAKIIDRGGRVYFRKQCAEHGTREDFVCSDIKFYDQTQYAVPAKLPREHGVEPHNGCPLDCGLCTEHEQHTCVGLVELTSSCNLTCPMCYASSSPEGNHVPKEQCFRAIDRLVEVEGRPEVLQLSGGEPTLHPDFTEIFEYAVAQPIDYVMINTNGIRFSKDPALVELVARHRDRVEIYFQLDALRDEVLIQLRGEPLLETKLRALDRLGKAGVHVMLVATLQGGLNEPDIGPLVKFGLERPWIVGLGLQPATYSGRHELPEDLEQRITFPDVIKAICLDVGEVFSLNDFMPLPCAHPNCHWVGYAYRHPQRHVPLSRFINGRENLDLLANGISFDRTRSRELLQRYLGDNACYGGQCGPTASAIPILDGPAANAPAANELDPIANEFFEKALRQQLGSEDLFRITITSFLDAYNFDVRRVMKCCTHNILPSGHVIPFCAYNVLYREGHVPMPALAERASL